MIVKSTSRLVFIITGLILLSASCTKENKKPVVPINPIKPGPVYSLVWSDEFDGAALDTTKWVFENRNPGVNNEKEYYLPDNVTISNGNLVLTAKKETFGGQPYTSGKITTFGKFTQLYGRIEARIKLPAGQGTWPAFWMLGANINTISWPACGEIDIMEQVNTDNVIYGTMHWDNNGHASYSHNTIATATDYHVYAVEWDTNEIRWYVDNTLYQTGNIAGNVNATGAFHLPFFIILNLAMGGDFPGPTVNESLLPESMYVDYVRVYKQTN